MSDLDFARACGDTPAEGASASVAPSDFLGVYEDLDFNDYLAADAVSKSSLWTLHTRSPAHAKVVKEPSNAMSLGTAIHCAVLEPDEFEARFIKGPETRRGNIWKEQLELHGEYLLTAGDYEAALKVRDEIQKNPLIKRLTGAGTVREVSGFWKDEQTGLKCRCRPDAYVPALNMLVDLKTTSDVRPFQFSKTVSDFGYHAQEALYTDGWRACGHDVDAFIFIAIESKEPHAARIYELTPDAVLEGRATMRTALDRWAQCVEAKKWPGYETTIEPLDIPRWAYQLTGQIKEAAE